MKRIITLLLCAFAVFLPLTATAQDAPAPPALTSIVFENATLEETFSPYVYEYTLILDNPSVPPTLQSYKMQGDANLFVTYTTDSTGHQSGVSATLEYKSGTVVYSFLYKNAAVSSQSGENRLASLECPLCEVVPAINDSDTEYKLYLPSDLTVLHLAPVLRDVGAVCDAPSQITLAPGQETHFKLTVTASNGDARTYEFKVKRLQLTMEEAAAQMQQEDFVSLVQKERFYRQPVFWITAGSALGALVLLCLFIGVAKRLTVQVADEDEKEFFD